MSARQLALGFGSLATVRKRWRFDDGATARRRRDAHEDYL